MSEISKEISNVADIDPLALDEEFQHAPADYAYWSHQLSQATKTALQAKFEREKTYARLLIEIRETTSKKTVDEVEARVICCPEYEVAKLNEIESDAERARLYGIVEALRVKKDMLIQLGAHVRAEMDRDPQIRELHRGRRSMRTEE
jgi:hypothetical protein